MRPLLALLALTACSTPSQNQQTNLANDFQNRWRLDFVSHDPRLDVGVVTPVTPNTLDPILTSTCSAIGAAPTIQLTWNEPADPIAVPDYRLDLTITYQGFERNYYSSAYPVAAGVRFLLPDNSSFMTDEPSILAIGPAIFPIISGYAIERVAPALSRVTLTLDEIGEARDFTLRFSVRQGAAWSETKRTVFLTPVCPTSF